MKALIRIAIHLGSIFGLLVLAALRGNPYSWMSEMDPTIPPDAIEDVSGNRFIFSTLVFVTIATIQLAMFFTASQKSGRWLPAFLAAAATILWILTI
ncbi:hypothetical protein SAMN05216321_11357 [Cupriavidus sp. OV038]|jgi:hypothetical protein|uniref:hypothetical protein n=1 Tax=unclassified Cupriavidus TaxID=2640874 RepID=UPI0008EE7236|nr:MULTISPECIES: hypothetical protein [unclassified Cupriavidus]SFD18013.1 hypothetical protein SAMN05216321_11357 [Cupriavidus sp. OV038]SFP88454.1 hypothetical protein SAMN05216322_112130 [Cupriavidus sp. OV096]